MISVDNVNLNSDIIINIKHNSVHLKIIVSMHVADEDSCVGLVCTCSINMLDIYVCMAYVTSLRSRVSSF